MLVNALYLHIVSPELPASHLKFKKLALSELLFDSPFPQPHTQKGEEALEASLAKRPLNASERRSALSIV